MEAMTDSVYLQRRMHELDKRIVNTNAKIDNLTEQVKELSMATIRLASEIHHIELHGKEATE